MSYACENCGKEFTRKDNLKRHNNDKKKPCIKINTIIKKVKYEDIVKENEKYDAIIKENEKLKKEIEYKNIKENDNYILNNRLIDIITDKNKTIGDLKEQTNIIEKMKLL